MTSRSSSCRAPFSRHRLLGGKGGGCRVRHIETREYFFVGKRGRLPTSQKALHKRPIYVYSSDEHRDEHERYSASELTCPHSSAFGGNRTKHWRAGLRWATIRHARLRIAKTLRMTRSSMWTSPIVFVRGKGSPLISKDRSAQRASVGGEHIRRVDCIDIPQENCGHPDLAAVLLRRRARRKHTFLGDLPKPNTRFRQCRAHPAFHRPKYSSQLRVMRGQITCFATREEGRNFV